MKKNKTILITGASSGIGQALALACARDGWRLLLMARNAERLEKVAQECRAYGVMVETSTIRVEAQDEMQAQVLAWDEAQAIDVVVANAGISGGSGHGEEKLREIMRINLDGVFNTVNPLIPRMQARKAGQIVLISSMAGFRGLPNAPAYSVSKVAVRAYADALRPLLKGDGIDVSVVFPGFVKTPLTDINSFPMPFLMSAEKAADIILCGVEQKKASIAFPWQMYMLCWLLSVLPRKLSDFILSYAPKKS